MAYDYKNYRPFAKYYETGFDTISLTDNYGKFYLIHPDELSIQRNLNGDIVGVTNPDGLEFIHKKNTIKGYVISKKIKSFWKMLLDYLYVDFANTGKNDIDNDENVDIIKTELGKQFIDLTEEFRIDNHNLLRTLLFGISMGCGTDIIKLCTIYQVIDFNISKLIKKSGKRQSLNTIVLPVSSKNNVLSDSETILEILKDLESFLLRIGISDKLTSRQYTKYINTNNEYNYTIEDYQYLLGPRDKYPDSLLNKIIVNDSDKFIEKIEDALLQVFDNIIHNKIQDIIDWADERNLDSSIIIKYLKKYIKFKSTVTRLMSDDFVFFLKRLQESTAVKNISNYFQKNNIIFERDIKSLDLALLLGFPHNICRKVDYSEYYLNIYSMILSNTYKIETFPKFSTNLNSFVSNQYLQKYILYLKSDIESDKISCLHYIKPSTFTILGHIYTPSHFTIQHADALSTMKKFIASKSDISILKDATQISSLIISYQQTLDTIKNECELYTNIKIKKFIESFLFKIKQESQRLKNEEKSKEASLQKKREAYKKSRKDKLMR
jgi:hypothetical protein